MNTEEIKPITMTIEELLVKLSFNPRRKVHIFADGKPARMSPPTLAPDGSVHISVKTIDKYHNYYKSHK